MQNQYPGNQYPAPQRLPGKIMLLVVGILCIVFAGIGLIALLSVGQVAQVVGAGGEVIISIVFVLYQLFAGIMALVNGNKKEKASLLLIIGAVLILIPVISIIRSGFDPLSILSFALPTLYLIGAVQNNKA